ncbi:hypothetical protein [Pedobacter ureilyticus]|uniref:Uncharacterized protein n=1 Tax=Pedobacter ureilyticus TaxID=1393051 RepID=A0ABW9J7J2_9SPHI|nr:hypothetical protein [Pedobacter helvus]
MDRKEEFTDKHLPKQEIGEQMDVVEKRTFENEAAAIDFFILAKYRLLNVNQWSLLAGSELSNFQLTNAFGNPIEGLAKEGDYLQIDIPGPGSATGDGYDWVYIESVIEEQEVGMEAVTLRARPASNPLSTNKDTAHFLTEQATSTFQVKRIGKHIYAEEHGRNEQANTYTTSTTDNIRNMLVGWAATLGLSYPQWKSLVKGILAD